VALFFVLFVENLRWHLQKSHLVSFLFCSVRVGVEARFGVGLVVRARDLTLVVGAHGCV